MQITNVAQSYALGSQAEFVVGPDESNSTKTFSIEYMWLSNGHVLKFIIMR